MIKTACIAAALVFGLVTPVVAQDTSPAYDFRERIRVLAFNPDRFFPERFGIAMSVR